jgi:hypothetical protein
MIYKILTCRSSPLVCNLELPLFYKGCPSHVDKSTHLLPEEERKEINLAEQ